MFVRKTVSESVVGAAHPLVNQSAARYTHIYIRTYTQFHHYEENIRQSKA